MNIPQIKCERCHHSWTPRVPDPRVCPACGSPYWNRPRKNTPKQARLIKRDK